MSTPQQDKDTLFAIEEFKALRVEIDNMQKQSYLMESAIVLGIASVFAFSAGKDNVSSFYWWCLWIVTLIASFRKWDMKKRVEHLGNYIAKIERKLYSCNDLGWEKYLDSSKKNNFATKTYWILVNVIVFSIATYQACSS
ncbi:hypothetical protein RJ44_13480 [Alteromonas macleodii]|uniref:hypothetical protein n=1 Tax=Alteromonas macleodii TaxID=28108 RepID=UPI00057E9474|nr:hypothetical protein [Alteromonas macleodii]KHT58231.1 hypothetical protein RJ44_13480 [Alteromonas macleodii]